MPLAVPAPPEGFLPIDDAAPFDLEAYMKATPNFATVRGMFFQAYVAEAQRRRVKLVTVTRDYLGFKHYPMREWQAVVAEAAEKFYPTLTLRGGLRRLGQRAYPTFADSTVGKVIFGVMGKDLSRIMRMALKGWQQAVNTAAGKVVDAGDNHVRMHLVGLYGFMDSFNLGVYEGTIETCDRRGEVYYRHLGHGEGEVFCRWW